MNILEKIVAVKREEVARLRLQADEFRRTAARRMDSREFAAALRGGFGSSQTAAQRGAAGAAPSNPPALIAEIKKASPSAGVICTDFDPVRIACEYERAGATALSVLTDEMFFQGHLDYLRMIRAAVKLPLLRKDFIIDEVQVYESVACGADAVLLIVAILNDSQLNSFSDLAKSLGVAALVEVHDEQELDRALAAEAGIIGINNRNLRDFSVSLETTTRLAEIIRHRVGATSVSRPLIVAESGIHTRGDVDRVRKAGVDAILVGESLMKSGDIPAKVKELLGG